MSNFSTEPSSRFSKLIKKIPSIGEKKHAKALLQHARSNIKYIQRSIKALPKPLGDKASSAIVISAGPSLHRCQSIQRIQEAHYQGSVVAVDGAYIACLKAGLIPDYVVTLDPHPTRIVRWFGDHNFEKQSDHDDYFRRQDLNIDFRENSIKQNKKHIEWVNRYGYLTKAIVSSSSPYTVVERILEAKFECYGWNPLVDDPTQPNSLTRKLYQVNRFPCLNTGGTVGTAAWLFATEILDIPEVAIVGMDYGYHEDNPISKTQTYYELLNYEPDVSKINEYFIKFENKELGKNYYIDPTYYWYRKNFLELFERSTKITYNCTEGGTLSHPNLKSISLDSFLNRSVKITQVRDLHG